MDEDYSISDFLKLIRKGLLTVIFLLYPLFFLPLTQEFYNINKLYLVAVPVLLYLLILAIELLFVKKISWKPLDLAKPVLLFFLAVVLSILISSPNKVEGALDPRTGLTAIFSLTVLYFILSQFKFKKTFLNLLLATTSIVGILNIIFFFEPFKNVNLPQSFQFLKNPGFTPLGTQLDLSLFFGFFAVLTIVNFLTEEEEDEKELRLTNPRSLTSVFIILIILLALFTGIFNVAKPIFGREASNTSLPPLSASWYANLEAMKSPKKAIFGVGPGNYLSIFTRAKPPSYNTTPFWNINFVSSSSFLLHILAETGLFGFFALILLLIIFLIKSKDLAKNIFFPSLYLVFVLIFFPPSASLLFLFFIWLSFVETSAGKNVHIKTFDLSEIVPAFTGLAVVTIGISLCSLYLLGRHYTSEYHFKKSLDGVATNNAPFVYNNLRTAVNLNPYIERYRASFANVNILIANSIATRSEKLTDKDRQDITQAIQIAIAESKSVAALNPDKASNWENLAVIYRNIINAIQGSDSWAIAAYQRAILADPVNPILRVNLGGVYYSLARYDDAKTMFEQAVSLKPDWANAHYNLAWTYFQKKEYEKAVSEMQASLNLVNPKSDDYKKGQRELADFKKNLAKQEEGVIEEKLEPKELNLPTPGAELEPKIELPVESSPEAAPQSP